MLSNQWRRGLSIRLSSRCGLIPILFGGDSKGVECLKTKIPAATGDKYVGWVMLLSTENGEPLAIFPDGVVQRMRVASSSAIAARYLARPDASTLALFGSGWQAGSHLPAMCAVRNIKRVNVYSPTKSNREVFAKEMQQKVTAEVRPGGKSRRGCA
jgi:ornithine cyclodeaminase/alanine dehydrogenase-like protein (mu-crystallin family)